MKKYTLDEVYTADMTAFQRERYNRVADEFEKLFGEKPTAFFSAPGRTEVGGNRPQLRLCSCSRRFTRRYCRCRS